MDLLLGESHICGMQFTVTVCHDEAERVWFVQSSEIPGLNAEAATFESLLEIIVDLAPELASANLPEAKLEGAKIPLCVQHVVTASPANAA